MQTACRAVSISSLRYIVYEILYLTTSLLFSPYILCIYKYGEGLILSSYSFVIYRKSMPNVVIASPQPTLSTRDVFNAKKKDMDVPYSRYPSTIGNQEHILLRWWPLIRPVEDAPSTQSSVVLAQPTTWAKIYQSQMLLIVRVGSTQLSLNFRVKLPLMHHIS